MLKFAVAEEVILGKCQYHAVVCIVLVNKKCTQ